jgi:hypothetical protein
VEGADALGLIAEVGIAIAGFAGVIAALRAPGENMGGYAAFRIGILFGTSAQAVLLALLPVGLHFAGLTGTAIWIISSSAMAGLVAMLWLTGFAAGSRVAPAAREDRAPEALLVAGVNAGGWAGIILLQLVNAMILRDFWLLYIGLFALTALAQFQFAYVLFAPSRVEVPA